MRALLPASGTCSNTARSCCACLRAARPRLPPACGYPDELVSAVRPVAPLSAAVEPAVALVAPRVYNSAYYEHSFLPDKVGIELVEGRDLVVKNEEVFMRTTEGLKRV